MPPQSVSPDEKPTDDPILFSKKEHLTLEDGYGKYYNSYKTLWGTFAAPLRWDLIIHIGLYHVAAVYTLFTFPFLEKKMTLLWTYILGVATIFGITAGVHRLWTHKSFKAVFPLQVVLSGLYSMAGHYSVFTWVRNHRIHHKFSDTDADPFDIHRGFFYAQIGFLFLEKHPECRRKGNQVDCSDLLRDPVIAFNKKYFWWMMGLCFYAIPIGVPMLLWNESFYWAFMMNTVRFVACLHITTAVNSVAHQIGTRPYDKKHQAVENMTYSIFALGEGWHNYHHSFPHDYRASEFGNFATNFTTFMLNLFAKFGWVYDLKTPDPELVKKFIIKHGDGSHQFWGKESLENESESKHHNEDENTAYW